MPKNLNWSTAEELNNISMFSKGGVVCVEDFNVFLKLLITNASSRLGVKYQYLEKLVKEHNIDFFKLKDELFKNDKTLPVSSNEFKELCLLLKLPVIEEIKERTASYMFLQEEQKKEKTHIECLDLFNSLSAQEKLKFILEFEKIQISLTPLELSTLLKNQ